MICTESVIISHENRFPKTFAQYCILLTYSNKGAVLLSFFRGKLNGEEENFCLIYSTGQFAMIPNVLVIK